MKNITTCCILLSLLVTGCTSTDRRSLKTAAGSAIGGGAGYLLGNKKPAAVIGGAAVGALATGLAMGEDPRVKQEGFDEGYIQGQSDSIKREYFLRQALETRPVAEEGGKKVQYVVPGPTVMYDGRKLEPHTLAITVTE